MHTYIKYIEQRPRETICISLLFDELHEIKMIYVYLSTRTQIDDTRYSSCNLMRLHGEERDTVTFTIDNCTV